MSEETEAVSRAQRLRRPLMIGGVVVVAAVALYFWLTGGRYVSTDNAYVHAAQTMISADVAGRVVELDVRENQVVRRGDVLYRLDDAPFRIAVDDARARLEAARLEVTALKARYRERRTLLDAAHRTQAFQSRQFGRQKGLLESGITSESQVEQAGHALDQAQAAIASNEQGVAEILASLGGDAEVDPEKHPRVLAAKAALDRAELDLRHATVIAPEDGIVAMVDRLQVGDYLAAAAPAFALVSTHDVWVEANFKEVQLTHVLPGQVAKVRVDLYPDVRLSARVVGLSPATGAQFSVLPPENATGNWVKVVQRLPVRLLLDADPKMPLLRSGLSAVVTVDTESAHDADPAKVPAPAEPPAAAPAAPPTASS